MTPCELLDRLIDRERTVELAYSLYECLTDLLVDIESIDEANDLDATAMVDRISVSAMNCLADMRLLVPPFESLYRYRFESTVD